MPLPSVAAKLIVTADVDFDDTPTAIAVFGTIPTTRGALERTFAKVIVQDVVTPLPTVTVPEVSFPLTDGLNPHDEIVGVPPPVIMSPPESIENKALPVDDATVNGFVPATPETESVESGVDEPTPTFPAK